ncbi:hypothetical protein M9H77_22935 [Catharanthus roseus]|uniref:Uncharacterized protein n=1 Tax=Catharanthus roseus TaxID=4058 RepID=A0ACC0ARH8_CATRO|nr:hypothetical protein M9H77_22935 [Catharanthus roseus]
METPFQPGLQSGYDHMFGSVRGLSCTWLVSHTRASYDDVDVSESGEWIHLKRGIDYGGCDPIGLRGHALRTALHLRVLIRSDFLAALETLILTQDSQRHNKLPKFLGIEFLDQISQEGHNLIKPRRAFRMMH